MQSRDCHADHDNFCYVCSKYEVKSFQKKIENNICNLYEEIFKSKMDKHNSWVPRVICNIYKMMLYR